MAGGCATLLNGYLITAVTVCDVHRATLCHTTPEVVPPALAIAERDGRCESRRHVHAATGDVSSATASLLTPNV